MLLIKKEIFINKLFYTILYSIILLNNNVKEGIKINLIDFSFDDRECYEKETINGIVLKCKSKKKKMFKIEKSIKQLNQIIENLPNQNEVFKFISVSGGFSSISFIKYVSEFEIIQELYATTLRVGKKEIEIIEELNIKKCFFIVCTIMQESTGKAFEYFNIFKEKCIKNKWKFAVVNNHSKIILIKTKDNFYVLETSSNLNENPKIEQFSFENSQELFEWYKELITEIIDNYS